MNHLAQNEFICMMHKYYLSYWCLFSSWKFWNLKTAKRVNYLIQNTKKIILLIYHIYQFLTGTILRIIWTMNPIVQWIYLWRKIFIAVIANMLKVQKNMYRTQRNKLTIFKNVLGVIENLYAKNHWFWLAHLCIGYSKNKRFSNRSKLGNASLL